MNPYQKAATLTIRVLGALIAVIGVLGLGYAIFLLASSSPEAALHHDRAITSVAWAVVGPLIVASSKRLGRLLGAGLD